MDEVKFEGKEYRLRAGSPMPISTSGEFVLHTFKAEVNDVHIIACTETLPASSDFRGQGGNLMSANFTRLNIKGGTIFSGKRVYAPSYIDEDDI
jgi:hypothetical protein